MQVIKPIRSKRKGGGSIAPESAAESAEASTAVEGTAVPPAPADPAVPPPESTAAPARGLLRKSAIRRWLKNEFDFPLQIREAFFAAAEAKFADDFRRSVARARELKRSTLMGPDA